MNIIYVQRVLATNSSTTSTSSSTSRSRSLYVQCSSSTAVCTSNKEWEKSDYYFIKILSFACYLACKTLVFTKKHETINC